MLTALPMQLVQLRSATTPSATALMGVPVPLGKSRPRCGDERPQEAAQPQGSEMVNVSNGNW
jgi:hypothetical protein